MHMEDLIECIGERDAGWTGLRAPPASNTCEHTEDLVCIPALMQEAMSKAVSPRRPKIVASGDQGELPKLAGIPSAHAEAFLQGEVDFIAHIEAVASWADEVAGAAAKASFPQALPYRTFVAQSQQIRQLLDIEV